MTIRTYPRRSLCACPADILDAADPREEWRALARDTDESSAVHYKYIDVWNDDGPAFCLLASETHLWFSGYAGGDEMRTEAHVWSGSEPVFQMFRSALEVFVAISGGAVGAESERFLDRIKKVFGG